MIARKSRSSNISPSRPRKVETLKKHAVSSGANTQIPASRDNYDDSAVSLSCEKVLMEQLCNLKVTLLKLESFKTQHQANQHQLNTRAQESVEEELSRMIVKLIQLQGPSPIHRISAYNQLSAQLNLDIEKAIFTDDKADISSLKQDQRLRKDETALQINLLSQQLSVTEQTVDKLKKENSALESANRSLSRSTGLLQRELEKASRDRAQINQYCVELRMQALDYKAEVDRRSQKIITSVQSRLGFVPTGIQKQVLHLRVMKPPGDPDYDEVRSKSYARAKQKRSKSATKTTDRNSNRDEISSTRFSIEEFLRQDSMHRNGRILDTRDSKSFSLSNAQGAFGLSRSLSSSVLGDRQGRSSSASASRGGSPSRHGAVDKSPSHWSDGPRSGLSSASRSSYHRDLLLSPALSARSPAPRTASPRVEVRIPGSGSGGGSGGARSGGRRSTSPTRISTMRETMAKFLDSDSDEIADAGFDDLDLGEASLVHNRIPSGGAVSSNGGHRPSSAPANGTRQPVARVARSQDDWVRWAMPAGIASTQPFQRHQNGTSADQEDDDDDDDDDDEDDRDDILDAAGLLNLSDERATESEGRSSSRQSSRHSSLTSSSTMEPAFIRASISSQSKGRQSADHKDSAGESDFFRDDEDPRGSVDGFYRYGSESAAADLATRNGRTQSDATRTTSASGSSSV